MVRSPPPRPRPAPSSFFLQAVLTWQRKCPAEPGRGVQDPGVRVRSAASSGPLLSQVPGVLPPTFLTPQTQESEVPSPPLSGPAVQASDPGVRAPPLAGPGTRSLLYLHRGPKCQPLSGAMVGTQTGRGVTVQASSARLGQRGLRHRPLPAFLIPQKFASRI